MKKISILLFAIMMVSSLSAQIDSFDDSDNFVVEQDNMVFDKFNYLVPYQGTLLPYSLDESGVKSLLICNNIIGEQVYFKETQTNNYILARNNEGLILHKIQPNTYYTVKDILITYEELDSLYNIFKDLPYQYKGDTIYYNKTKKVVIFDVKSKKVSKAIIPKESVLRNFSYRSWPTRDKYVEQEKEALADYRKYNVKEDVYAYNAIYILADEKGIEYYVSLKNSNYLGFHDVETDDIYGSGNLIGISRFLAVRGYNNIKSKFENQYVREYFGQEVFICKKIALKDGDVVAALTDTLSTTVSYIPVKDIYMTSVGGYGSTDSLICARMIVTSPYNSNYKEDVDYYTLHDIDSLKNKNAYEEHLAEIEKAKKDEKRKQELIKKYGQKYGTSIFNKEACVGMTKAMCKEAIGSPDQVTKSQTSSGNVEVWSYTLAYQMWNGLAPIIVVTFTNDRVTAVDKYTSWPF